LRTYIPNQRAERYNKRIQPSLPDEETPASTSFEDVIQSVAADPSTSNCDETSMIGAESSMCTLNYFLQYIFYSLIFVMQVYTAVMILFK